MYRHVLHVGNEAKPAYGCPAGYCMNPDPTCDAADCSPDEWSSTGKCCVLVPGEGDCCVTCDSKDWQTDHSGCAMMAYGANLACWLILNDSPKPDVSYPWIADKRCADARNGESGTPGASCYNSVDESGGQILGKCCAAPGTVNPPGKQPTASPTMAPTAGSDDDNISGKADRFAEVAGLAIGGVGAALWMMGFP